MLHRVDFAVRHAVAFQALRSLEGMVSPSAMMRMNASAELDAQPFTAVAGNFLAGREGSAARGSLWSRLTADDFWRLTMEHGALVLGALLLSVVTGVPLGVWAARSRRARPWVLGVAGGLQTIPSLALLAFLIAVLGGIVAYAGVLRGGSGSSVRLGIWGVRIGWLAQTALLVVQVSDAPAGSGWRESIAAVVSVSPPQRITAVTAAAPYSDNSTAAAMLWRG